jgi:hypothetical protein
MLIKIELDIDKAYWFDAVGGIDIPCKVGEGDLKYRAHLQIPCMQSIAARIIDNLKQEATNG